MTRCSECKHWIPKKNDNIIGVCEQYDCPISAIGGVTTYDDMSCIHAERADGLAVCCATCKHNIEEGKGISYMSYCHKKHWDDSNADKDVMSCPEWAPREEKE